MSDIVERLRLRGTDICCEASDEIERLRGVIKTGRLCDPIHCTFGNENEIVLTSYPLPFDIE